MKIIYLIPTYNDEDSLIKLINEINKINADFKNNFLIINDGSEKKYEKLKDLNNVNELRVKLNQGNQICIGIGLSYLLENDLKFDFLIIMDGDGEDDPKYIKDLINTAKKNDSNEIIFASRGTRQEGYLYKLFYFWYKIFFRILTGQKIHFGNYSCIPYRLLNKFEYIREIYTHYSASIIKSKISYKSIICNKGHRYFHTSKLNFYGFVKHALKSFSVFSDVVLMRMLFFCFIGFFFSTIGIVLLIILKFFYSEVLLGWTSSMILGFSIIDIIFFLSMVLTLINLIKNKETNYNFNLKNFYKKFID